MRPANLTSEVPSAAGSGLQKTEAGGLRRVLLTIAAFLVALVMASPAAAHVAFDSPSANDTLVAGETLTITWVDVIPHDTSNYVLDFVPAPNEPAVPIADIAGGQHSYDWVIPDMPCDECALSILQVNIDYADFPDTVPIVIVSGSDDQAVSGASGSGASGCGVSRRPAAAFPTAPLAAFGLALLGVSRRRLGLR